MPLLAIRLRCSSQKAHVMSSAMERPRVPNAHWPSSTASRRTTSASEDQSEEEGEAKSDAPLSSAIHGVSTQVDAVSQEARYEFRHGKAESAQRTLAKLYGIPENHVRILEEMRTYIVEEVVGTAELLQ
jgi:hypothetical protein